MKPFNLVEQSEAFECDVVSCKNMPAVAAQCMLFFEGERLFKLCNEHNKQLTEFIIEGKHREE
jgi:hypothetical protein